MGNAYLSLREGKIWKFHFLPLCDFVNTVSVNASIDNRQGIMRGAVQRFLRIPDLGRLVYTTKSAILCALTKKEILLSSMGITNR